MERAISVEEKIRRAEERYERKMQGEIKPIAKVPINKEKKDIELLKKMIIQICICVLIYLGIYQIQNKQYVFSNDVLNKANEILSYDKNFSELYNKLKEKMQAFFLNNTNQDNTIDENSIGGATETEGQDENVKSEENQINNEREQIQGDENKNLTQEEQDILNIKNTTSFIKPIEGVITSNFGQRETKNAQIPKNHTGVDIATNLGTKIKSATDGEVVLASEEGDYGKHLKIQIGEVSIVYAHCNNLYVKQGDKITQGQEIAEVGTTGNSTGPHLHFEIRISERYIDPQKIIDL